jgi:uncharacterized damage-inducible protein DinB
VNDLLLDAFRHDTWATARLLQSARSLTRDQLAATVPGTYGSVLATLHHLILSEGFYCYALTEGKPGFDWDISAQPALDELERRSRDVGQFWERYLSHPIDPERVVARRGRDGTRDEASTGVVLAQVLSHGSVHREQVSAVLTSLGIAPPEVDAWAYGIAAGRVRMGLPAESQ